MRGERSEFIMLRIIKYCFLKLVSTEGIICMAVLSYKIKCISYCGL